VSIQELGKQIVVVSFAVSPADATVLVDGAPVDPRQPLRLLPSRHAVIVEKPGFAPHSEEIEPAAGERPTVSVTLEPVAVAEPEPAPAPPPSLPPAEPGPDWRLWTGVGVTTTLAAGWVIAGLYAQAAHDDFGDSGLSLEERRDAQDRGRNLALASDVMLFGAVVAAGFTAYLYLGTEDDPAQRQALVPVLFPGGGGAAFAGEF
jgi:hypothetical protein